MTKKIITFFFKYEIVYNEYENINAIYKKNQNLLF